jgi:carboxylate-amine ligase
MLGARASNSEEAELLQEAPAPVSLRFNPTQAMTLGVEIEIQIVDAATLDLAPGAPIILEALRGADLHIKPELYQSMIEINTGICVDVPQVRDDLTRALAVLRATCEPLGFDLVSAGTHPFALYGESVMFPSERYRNLIDRNRWLTQRLLSFGLHVHVGMRDGEHAMAMMNAMLNYLPHLLALSASSPYWQGRDTGLASSRITLFEALPTAGHPCTMESWDAFEAVYRAMVRSRAITSIKDIWWDIRPHHDFGTVESRICVVPVDRFAMPISVSPSPLKSPVSESSLEDPNVVEKLPVDVNPVPVASATDHAPLL